MKSRFNCLRGQSAGFAAALLVWSASQPDSTANPAGAIVTQGSASVSSQGSTLTIQTGGNTAINWSSFNIASGETTVFIQPSATSLVWNRINDANPSQILGNLDANGYVVLQNPSGFYVGGQASITAHGLIMTTASTPPPDISGGGAWQFNAPPPTASIINYGQIGVGNGSAFLIANNIENHGAISAPGGNIGLYAGKQVMISTSPDGRGLSATVTLPQGSVDNSGKLVADAGTIALNAQVVNQGGLIQANSIHEQNGVIDLEAADSLDLSASSVISAKGGSQGASAGGNVTLKSGNSFQDSIGSVVDVSGGAQGGNGGHVDVSAPDMSTIQSQILGGAAQGFDGGGLLIDPLNVLLTTPGTAASSGTINAGDPPTTGTLSLDVNSFSSFSQILVQATQNITVGTIWSLGDSTIPASLTLQAGNNLTINNGAGIQAGQNWTINLDAGTDFSQPNSVIAGVGSLTLSRSASISAQNGNINVMTGQDVTVGSGGIVTFGGGNVTVNAGGDVNTGTSTAGFTFSSTGYAVSAALGGISTAAGGNVTITAGGTIQSFLPSGTGNSAKGDAGSGAFGPEPGVVTIEAGGDITGHFVAVDSVDSTGKITPSTITSDNGDAGSFGDLLALSLVKGDWAVSAPNGNIYLQEVRNPNGVFNGAGGSSSPFRNRFDYDPLSSVELTAGQSVHLEGTELPRITAAGGTDLQVIYPPSLTINAGPGGIFLGNDVTLYPSPNGNLTINSAGPMETETAGQTQSLIMSDSGSSQWVDGAGTFDSSDHAAIPLQLNNLQPVIINVAGNLQDLNLFMPKATQITVGGSMIDCAFQGQNLHPGDITSITVAGAIFNPSPYTFLTLNPNQALQPPNPLYPGEVTAWNTLLNAAILQNSLPSDPTYFTSLGLNLFYDPATLTIGYAGPMPLAVEQALLSPFYVPSYNQLTGVPILNPVTGRYANPNLVSLVWDPSVITQLYALSQNAIPTTAGQSLGYQLGGPGYFKITAGSVDLGVSYGIQSLGPAPGPGDSGDAALARYGTSGTEIDLDVKNGDLDMTSSVISSQYGGNVNIDVENGALNVGAAEIVGADNFTRGIFTSGASDVNVLVSGDINIAGSRIAAYDGGDVSVKSLTGNVNAGTGALSTVSVTEVQVDPATFAVTASPQTIAGSGILATTLPDSPIGETVGNITVSTPQGSIIASEGGISQVAENGNVSLLPTIMLTAGTLNPDKTVLYVGDIEAGNGGVIGVNTDLQATGNISGLVVASGNATVNAGQNVSGTFLAGGTANLNAGGNVSGIAIAGAGLNVGGTTAGLTALAQNFTANGATSQSALAPSSSAAAGVQNAGATAQTDANQQTALPDASGDDPNKRKLSLLTRLVKRVTVILPKI